MNAYLVLDLKINDFNSFREYIEKIPDYIAIHHGRYVVQGVEPKVIEGDWSPERIVIIEFPSNENAEAFLNDPVAQPLFSIRQSSTTSKLILVDGCL